MISYSFGWYIPVASALLRARASNSPAAALDNTQHAAVPDFESVILALLSTGIAAGKMPAKSKQDYCYRIGPKNRIAVQCRLRLIKSLVVQATSGQVSL